MFEKELTRFWQDATEKERVRFEKSRLLLELDQKIERFNKKMFGQRVMEVVILIILLAFLIYHGVTVESVWQTLGAFYLVVFVIYHLFCLIKPLQLQRKALSANQEITGFLKEYHQYLVKEQQYFRKSLYWIIVPFLPGFILLFIDQFSNTQFTILFFAFLSLGIGLGYLYSIYTTKKRIQPIIDSAEETINLLTRNEESSDYS